MKQEQIKRTFVFAYVAMIVTQVCEIGYNFFLYKTFLLSDIGLMSWAAALVVFFNVAVDLGVEPILIRKFGKTELSLITAFKATFLPRGPLIVFAVIIVTTMFIYSVLNSEEYWMLILIGGQVLFNVSDGVFRAWLKSNGRQSTTNFISALISMLKLVAIVLLSFWENSTIYHILAILLVIRAFGSMLVFYLATSLRGGGAPSVNGEKLLSVTGNLLKAGVALGGIGALTAVQNRLDWLLISHYLSIDALATYSLANKFYEVSQVIVGVAFTTTYPWICRSKGNDHPMYSILLRVILMAGVVIGVVGVVLAPLLISMLFGSKYTGINSSVQVLMLSVGYMAAGGVFYNFALAKGFERGLLFVTIVTTFLQFLSNVILIPRIGVLGAAYGMLTLVVCTSLGLAIVVSVNRLFSLGIVFRMLGYLVLYPCIVSIVLLLELQAWIATLIGVSGVILLGWWTLFDKLERQVVNLRFLSLLRS